MEEMECEREGMSGGILYTVGGGGPRYEAAKEKVVNY